MLQQSRVVCCLTREHLEKVQDAGEPLLPFWADEGEKPDHAACISLAVRFDGAGDKIG